MRLRARMCGRALAAVLALTTGLSPLAAATPNHSPSAPADLTVGDRARPLNVEGAPLFGWRPRDRDPGEVQSAYRILVRTGDGHTVWDSGRVASARQEYVAYAGPELTPATSYTWTVRTWDVRGAPSPWAATASFDTGLRDADWAATWIRRTTGEPDDYTLARKDFTIRNAPIVRARAYVAASHQYELHLNGEVIDRGGAFSYPDEGYYRTVDVTARLAAAEHATIGALYHWYGGGQGRPAGEPGLLVRLVVDHADGVRQVVVTDSSWQVTKGPWLAAPQRNGDGGDYVEDFDATAEPLGWNRPGFDASAWRSPQVIGTHPSGVFTRLRGQETDLTTEVVTPRSITKLDSGAVVADFGRVLTAVPLVTFHDGQPGRRIPMRAGYLLAADGSVSRSPEDNQNTDLSFAYTERAGEQTFRAFTYVGFRYLEIAAGDTDIRAVLQHTAVDPARTARLDTDDPRVDAVFDLMLRSALYGAQEQFLDTPTREKGQFLGDAVDISTATMAGYGERGLTRQAIRQFIASQQRYWPDGRLNAVYPNGDGKRDIPDYTEVFPGWVWDYHLHSGDRQLLGEAYPVMTAVADYVRRHIDDTGLVTRLTGGSGAYQYGIVDWPATMRYGYDMDTAARTTVNILAVDALRSTANAAEALGRDAEAHRLRADASTLAGAINQKLRDTNGRYIDGLRDDGSPSTHASQIAGAYALSYGIVPPESRGAVVDHVIGLGLRMGPMTAHRLLNALTENPDAVVARLTDEAGPGWANILARGGTFTWESWDAPETGQSLSHSWGATALAEMQRTLLGVTSLAPAGSRIRIRPPHSGVDSAAGTVPIQRGQVAVDWRRSGDDFTLRLDVPVNVRAEVHVPARDAASVRFTGKGKPRLLDVRDGYAVYEIGSGQSVFRS
ncbi:glycoside hydrolase family 78 protein [Saccharothrix sp. AJ9571]|nr:glycoside hydrolase family 78 protein [Saccharothrix sp. AJ9571]